MQMIHDFGFEQHFFPLISVETHPKFKKNKDEPLEVEIETGITVHNVDNKQERLFLELRVKMKGSPEKTPYAIDVVAACFASTQLDTSDDITKNLAAKIGYKILFPAVRELVLSLTARQPWGQFSIGIDTDDEIEAPAKKRPRRARTEKTAVD